MARLGCHPSPGKTETDLGDSLARRRARQACFRQPVYRRGGLFLPARLLPVAEAGGDLAGAAAAFEEMLGRPAVGARPRPPRHAQNPEPPRLLAGKA
jgi:hypothetical protein